MGNQAKGILVPVDFTEAAKHATINAIELGEKLNADVYLVNFIPPSKKTSQQEFASKIEALSVNLASSINLLKENEQKLAEMLRKLNNSNVVVHSEIKIDKLASGVKKQLKKKKIGLIVIGITGAQTVGDSLCRNSQAYELIEVDCPIMVCNNHSHEFKEHHKVVVSLDFDSLDQRNITNLVEIAKKLSSKIHYIHVNHPSDKKKWTKERIAAYLRKHKLSADAIEIIDSDHKDQAIRRYANDQNADFIAISRFSKNGSYKKSYTEQVVEETENPVFVY